jgi:uncharacterized membrane protein
VVAGANHFISPATYLAIVPPLLPWPTALVYISGTSEVAGGMGILLPQTRKFAAIGLILLLIAVFPANVYAAQYGMRIGHLAVARWMLWIRLPLQVLLIAWVYFAGWKTARSSR